MKLIKGFYNVPSLVVNVDGQVSPIGELSPISKTFTRTLAEYKDPDINLVSFTTFTSTDASNEYFVLDGAMVNGIATIGEYVVDTIINGSGFNTLNELIQDLESSQSTIGTDYNAGPFVSIGLMSFPSWISWTTLVSGEEHQIHMWLADAAFRTQYKDFTIIVIPPLETLDLFFGTFSSVYNLMQNRSTEDLFTDIQNAAGNLPYTRSAVRTYNWVNPNNTTQTVPTEWGVVIYGEAGNNEDHIRSAIVEFILDNSMRPRADWKVIFPSLFVGTEFVIVPFWDRISIENQSPAASLYSAIIRPNDLADYALLAMAGYDEVYIRTVVEGSFFTYKNLAFTMYGGSENIDGKVRLHEKFPDYLPINPQVPDFSRMAPITQGWVNLINEMLPIAESLTDTTSLQPYMSIIVREGVTYLGSRYDNTLYLIAARSNF